ncbi:MAG: dihydroorotase [Sphingobacteriales bacterium]|nr:MAG: dihydroorotase [Sphingobacteriales bacterium]TAF82836.1 MAG: dihydroorotase [Sphingobacteriales bacterium]
MANTILIKQASIINEGKQYVADVFVKEGIIQKIDKNITEIAAYEINAEGKYLLPGLIDDQVHFREPGLTHKAEIYTEAKAAIAGGITSYMEMPNTVPSALTQKLLEDKYQIAAQKSLANYSFFMGASNNNLDEIMKTNVKKVCGIKIFMGSSTGDMLVDDEVALEKIFANAPTLVASHCETDPLIKLNFAKFKQQYSRLNAQMHPKIRSEEACYLSSSKAVALAQKYGTRLHILHISTAKETYLFDNNLPLKDKKITAEACIHHLWFSDKDYAEKGNFIKWNPAIKTEGDKNEILKAVIEGRIDVIATDHAPHTLAEKQQDYENAPSGGPLVQHALNVLLEMYQQGKISLESIVEKTAHNPAILFNIDKRGYIKEGYWADLVLVDLNKAYTVSKQNILSKCGWSPFEGQKFSSLVTHTIVSGNLVYQNGIFNELYKGSRLLFNR